jgi:hypothetical protein
MIMELYVPARLAVTAAQNLLAKPNRPLARTREMIRIELFYLPFFLFNATFKSSSNSRTDLIAIDGIHGDVVFLKSLDLQSGTVAARESAAPALSWEQAEEYGRTGLRRQLFHRGWKMWRPHLLTDLIPDRLVYYPYYLGYFKKKGAIDFDAIDAVSGRHQGVRVKSIFIETLVNKNTS